VPAFSYKALDVATSAKTVDFAVNGVNVAANAASSLESLGVLPDNGVGHDSSEATKAVAAGSGAWGAAGEIATDMGELVRGIRL
jgi:hypothetical protein